MNPKELLELLKGRGYKGIPTGCTEETVTVFLENDLENVFRAFYGTYLWKQELKEAEELKKQQSRDKQAATKAFKMFNDETKFVVLRNKEAFDHFVDKVSEPDKQAINDSLMHVETALDKANATIRESFKKITVEEFRKVYDDDSSLMFQIQMR